MSVTDVLKHVMNALNEPDVAARKNCARMCEMSSGLMSMDAQFAKDHCNLCATICDKCAQEYAMFKDDHCQKCAQECRTCADEYRKMAGMQ